MPRTIAIALDGVLQKPLDVEAQDVGGSLLYASLVSLFRVVVLGTENPDKDEHFLRINGMRLHAEVTHPNPEGVSDPIWDQVSRLRRDGYHFEFVVLDDPLIARRLIQSGQPVLLYAHPQYTPEIFAPQTQRAWGDLVDEIEYRRDKRAGV